MAAALALGAVQAASAADVPARPIFKAPPPAAVATNWSGFYLTGGAGYGLWASDTTTSITPGSPAAPMIVPQRQGGRGWLGRVGGGFDYQFGPQIVAGVFADFDFSSIEGTLIDIAPGFVGEIKQTASWAAGGRAGWLITPQLLSYFNIGYTGARFSSVDMLSAGGPFGPAGTPTGFGTQAFTRDGWFLGGGTETALDIFGGGWFWRNEYRYAYYGSGSIPNLNVGSALPFPAFNSIYFKPTVQTVTTQVVYKFNAGSAGPAYAAAAPVLAAPANWSGFYLNAGGGYGLWAADTTATLVPIEQTQGGKGWLGRVGGGFDYQFNQRIVAGLFADFDFSRLKGSIQDQAFARSGDIRQTQSWSAGGRAGWLVTPAILSYVNAGYTNAEFSSVNLLRVFPFGLAGTASGFATPEFTTDGWFLGGGTEASLSLFGGGWFWRNEYRYARYETSSLPEVNLATGAAANAISFKPDVQTVTTQLVYKFNWSR
jgi:outer membrane immunogenic protein